MTGEPLKKLMHALSTGGYQEELRGRAQNDALSTLEAETLRELEDLQNAGRILLSMSQLESMGLSGLHANSFVAQSVDGTDFCRFWRPLPGIPDLRHDSFVEVAIDDDPRSRMYFKPETSLSSGRAPLLAGAKFDLMRMADTGEFKGLASQAGKRAFASLGFKSETASDEDDRSPSRRPHANKAATDPPPSPPPSPPAQSSASKSGKASGGNASKKEGPADLSMSDSRKEKAKKAASNYGFVSEDETATGDEVALVATANEKRRYAHKLWDEKQPLLGCTLQYVAGGGEVEIVEPVWPTYSMMPVHARHAHLAERLKPCSKSRSPAPRLSSTALSVCPLMLCARLSVTHVHARAAPP